MAKALTPREVLARDLDKEPEYYRGKDLLPNLLHFLARTMPLIKNDDGLISCSKSLAAYRTKIGNDEVKWDANRIATSAEVLAIFKLFKSPSRSKFVASNVPRYKGAVPLFLSAFKEHKNIKYSAWDLSDPKLETVTDPSCYAQIKFIADGGTIDYTEEQLNDLRVEALTMANGTISSDTQFKCNNTSDMEFNKLPKSVRMSILQLWDYHINRANEYMIRNFEDIDKAAPFSLALDAVPLFKPVEKEKELTAW
jgi:hypothetical protein